MKRLIKLFNKLFKRKTLDVEFFSNLDFVMFDVKKVSKPTIDKRYGKG